MNVFNLTRLRDWLVKNREIVTSHLDMSQYVRDISTDKNVIFEEVNQGYYVVDPDYCNTNCCLLGFSLTSGEFTGHGSETCWSDFVRGVYGIDDRNYVWDFLFSHEWDNDFDYALRRINYVIEHQGEVPEGWGGSDTSAPDVYLGEPSSKWFASGQEW